MAENANKMPPFFADKRIYFDNSSALIFRFPFVFAKRERVQNREKRK